jgi:2-polyprenyl-3-methyl-5-hydroxy-6-metoxy-1,4-benzoquinol methylase
MTKTRPERPRSTTPSAAGLPSPGGAALYAAYHDDLGGFETHRAAMAWIEPGARVVDVGCSTGFFARHLVEEKGCRVIGIERDARAAAEARKACERVYVGNLEDPTFLEAVDSQGDVIFFGDVLEHLGITLFFCAPIVADSGAFSSARFPTGLLEDSLASVSRFSTRMASR